MKKMLALLIVLILPALPSFASSHSGTSHSYNSHSYSSHSRGACCTKSSSDVHVHGYTKKNGTVVQPYTRTHQDSTQTNNFSTKGNVNPYTGKPGTKTPTH
jgi:predicted S18 family serine protease